MGLIITLWPSTPVPSSMASKYTNPTSWWPTFKTRLRAAVAPSIPPKPSHMISGKNYSTSKSSRTDSPSSTSLARRPSPSFVLLSINLTPTCRVHSEMWFQRNPFWSVKTRFTSAKEHLQRTTRPILLQLSKCWSALWSTTTVRTKIAKTSFSNWAEEPTIEWKTLTSWPSMTKTKWRFGWSLYRNFHKTLSPRKRPTLWLSLRVTSRKMVLK